ncbi:hypothetical protein PIB30_052526 [Stylosanthes scabra]|uniref:Transposase MuDR plant domain-containing protein n=1 Tax=Stylosanthes scabra TaxID=79078 RepID=A0ABU6ZGY1_9FABA|nr:hypothetical protein [Stylosanthes scabra]
MDQPLIIRLHPIVAIHERQDEVWLQSDSPVVFQHADISTMSELVAVFLYNLGGGFTEIRKVGYRFLQRQPNGRFVHQLVWLFNDEHVRVTFGCHRRLMPQHVMVFLVEVGGNPSGPPVAATPVRIAEPPAPETEAAMDNSEPNDSDYATSTASSSDVQEGGECGADTRQLVVPVTSFRHRLQFQGWRTCLAFSSSLTWTKGHEAVQTAVKNYIIRRNADRIKYHCRCKHAEDGCLWSIRVALRQNLGRFGSLDHRDVDDGVMVVTNSGNTGDEETVCDRLPEADKADEPEMLTDNTAEARTDRMTGPGVMADNTTDAVMADGTAVVMAGNTETPDTAELGQDEAARVVLAYKLDHRRAEMQDIPVQFDPSFDHCT